MTKLNKCFCKALILIFLDNNSENDNFFYDWCICVVMTSRGVKWNWMMKKDLKKQK